MPTDFMVDLLRKWRAGHKLTKAQYAELVNDNLLAALDNDGTYALTVHGNNTLKNN